MMSFSRYYSVIKALKISTKALAVIARQSAQDRTMATMHAGSVRESRRRTERVCRLEQYSAIGITGESQLATSINKQRFKQQTIRFQYLL